MKILLTGASGFISRHTANRLLQSGCYIYAPVRRQSFSKIKSQLIHENLTILEGDFFDIAVLNQLAKHKPDAVLHFASIRGAGNGSADVYEKINVTGTQVLLDFALQNNIPNFLYCSTVGVLGTIPQQQPAGNASPEKADGIYHQTKLRAEQLVRQSAEKGLKTLILRPTITYGSGDDGFFPKLVSLVRSGRFPLSTKDFSIHLLHVQALARLVQRTVEAGLFNNKTYIVADRQTVIFADLVKQIARETSGKYRRIPAVVFTIGNAVLKLAGLTGLHTSLRLISAPWTYNISNTITDLGYVPDETAASVGAYIKEYV